MYNIKNLTHRSVEITDTVSVAPHSAIEFNGDITPQIKRFEQMGLITISRVKAAQSYSTGLIDTSNLLAEARRRNAEKAAEAKAAKKTTKK